MLGAGGHGKVVADAALACGLGELLGFLDDDESRMGVRVLGARVRGALSRVAPGREVVLVMGIGDNSARRRAFERAHALEYRIAAVVHPSAIVGRECVVGVGAVLLARVTVNTGTRIGDNAILNTACSVDHDCDIGPHAHVAPGSTLAGNVTVGEGALIGAATVAIPGITVGARAIVGAGSVIVRDLPAGCLARGVPARVVDAVGEETT